MLGLDYLVVHLGSSGGKGATVGIRNIANAVNHALAGSEGKTVILLENMAGQKNCVGARFEELRALLDLVQNSSRVGICLDTCHVYAAGFDLGSEKSVETAFGLFDDIVGMNELKVVHLNDSKGPLGSHMDRHEHIGMGNIGTDGMRAILTYKGIRERPIIMETPIDDARGQKEDLQVARRLLANAKS
jgi:deoxyribonuclease-4